MLVLVRHGQTDENAAGLVQGQMHGTLSIAGREGVSALAASLRDVAFDRVYASDLLRARLTAEMLVEQLGCSALTTDIRLREQGFGIYEGKPVFRLLRKLRRDGVNISEFVPDGGESPVDFRARLREFYDECLLPFFDATTTMVVTHYGVMRVFLEDVMGVGAVQGGIHNASCLRVVRSVNGEFRIIDLS